MGTGNQLGWITEGTGQLGSWATIGIPQGMGFLNGSDAAKLMKMFGNLGGEYVGALATNDLEWTVIFQFSEEGYVKDDDKDDLHPAKLMKALKEGQEEANKQRKQMGLETLTMVGWAVEPKYNETTNNLEWGTIIAGESGAKTVNYETRLLGRHGFMNVTLLCDPEVLDATMPAYQSLLTTFAYVPGKTYGEFRDGDKVAKYGLTALVAGGAAYAAVKTGLLATILAFAKKLWYLVVAAIAAVWSGIKRLGRRATGQQG
jgi:uncharacterized membrane-anchored protein